MSTGEVLLLLFLLMTTMQLAITISIVLFTAPVIRRLNEAITVMKALNQLGRSTHEDAKAATAVLSKRAEELTTVPIKVEEVKQALQSIPDKVIERVKEG